MKKRYKLKSSVYYILGIIIILVIGICFGIKKYNEYQYKKTNEYKLTTIGYTLDEAKELLNNLNTNDITYILNIRYDNNILKLIQEKYFIKNKFQEYYEYYQKNKKKELKDIVSTINTLTNNAYYSLDLNTDMSKEYAILVNKYYKLDSNYEPEDLVSVKMDYSWGEYGSVKVRQIVMDKFLEMWQDALQSDIYLMISSGYRSYADQEIVYENYKKNQGEAYADKIAAKPGYSEHQTGLSIDIFSKTNSNRNTFSDSEAAKWLKDNAYKYGFILRYPSDKVSLTGYQFESWHYRYVGLDIAKYIYENDITYEEYYAYFLDK